MTRTWRELAAPLIAHVIADTPSRDLTALRPKLRAAYPWGERKYHPYKIWCAEIRRQLGIPTPRTRRSPLRDPVPPEQGRLFS